MTEVKIDKSFVHDMGTDAGDAAIVETIVGLARHLGLRVVAEGVEDELSRERLVNMGCDLAQGYPDQPSAARGPAGRLARGDRGRGPSVARSRCRPAPRLGQSALAGGPRGRAGEKSRPAETRPCGILALSAPLAQSVERLHGKEKVYGSIP